MIELGKGWSWVPGWFRKTIQVVMEHNGYPSEWANAEIADKNGKWSPVDLVLREYYNNGCGSAEGFLGIKPSECRKAAEFAIENQGRFRKMHAYSKDGCNNFGFPLWKEYSLD